MEVVDLSKAVRRKTDRRRHLVRRVSGEENSALARIAHLQHVLDSGMRNGDKDAFIAGRREISSLIFSVLTENVCERKRN